MLKFFTILFLSLFLAACTNTNIPLDKGLTARMDAPNASLDQQKALSIINHLRITKNSPALISDIDLIKQANILAQKYATNGITPKKPKTADAIQISAGYANFANTFSGWRSNNTSLNTLTNPNFSRAGIGVAYSQNSTNGVYWVLLLSK